MRHYKKGRKLGTDASHTKAIKKNLAVALFTNDRIKTIDARAKEVRGLVDKIITWAKKGDLHSRRLAIAALGDAELVREVFEKAEQGMWAGRDGGYTRILKLGPRKGDNAPMVILELVNEAASKKGKKVEASKASSKKAGAKKPAAKKDAGKTEKGAGKAEEAKEPAAVDGADEKKADDAPENADAAAAEKAEKDDAAEAQAEKDEASDGKADTGGDEKKSEE
jgi:large subunit ribosomal protein L17